MAHHPLIATIVIGLVLAFVFGAVAQRLRASPLVGYLVAGIVVGPYTPGFVADQALAGELAEIGVILLMFGVGLHFSLGSLLSVGSIAVPGAIGQILVATLLGMGLAWTQDWSTVAGFVFGLSLSVASTVVLLRALQERRLLETTRGRIAVGWLVVEDLAMVVALVLVPPLVDMLQEVAVATAASDDSPFRRRDILTSLTITFGQVAGFVVVMLVIGRRVIPWILHYVAHTGSRELFRLSVLSIALGVAYGATELFGISFALGAFFAGMMLHESPLSQRAAEESLPLRDAFAVLFFVSVGMLFDPGIVVRKPWLVAATLFVILFGKSIAAFLIVRAFGYPVRTAMTISASLAQIGEFSFILAGLGVALQILPPEGRDLILAGALISILANPLFFFAIERLLPAAPLPKPQEAPGTATPTAPQEVVEEPAEIPETSLKDHAVIVGYGRVGGVIGEELERRKQPLLVIEEQDKTAAELRARGIEVIEANGALSRVLAAANLKEARWLFVAIPDAFEAGQIVNQARELNPDLPIIARAHSDAEVDHLVAHGASHTIMGEREIALGMLEFALREAPQPKPVSEPEVKDAPAG